ncbi:MAG: hypothetical protein QF357_00435 [Dehalococcoidia bacterium]|nr:hypothetical protein [Dehalococcoidia bacterium]
MQVNQISNRWPTAVFLVAGIFALFTLAACGNDDNDPSVAGAAPTQATAPATTSEPTVASAITVPATQVPPAAPVVPAIAPEAGSDEAQILAVLEKQVNAVHEADYVAFQETCTPTGGILPTIARLKTTYEDNQGWEGISPIFAVRFSPQGYNVRNVEVKLLREPFASADIDVFDYDEYKGSVLRSYEKVDGQWYSETLPCGDFRR